MDDYLFDSYVNQAKVVVEHTTYLEIFAYSVSANRFHFIRTELIECRNRRIIL